MSQFRTPVEILTPSFQLDYSSSIVSVGSCFAQNIGEKLGHYKFNIVNNPFGLVYNPASMAGCIDRIIEGHDFTGEELFFANDLWNSFAHHSRFSDCDQEKCLTRINRELQAAHEKLKAAHLLILTFGTAWIYENAEDGSVVNNCHKLPADRFRRHRLTIAQVIETMSVRIELLEAINPELCLLFSVSPVRHWKDGPVENQISKATLLLAANELVDNFQQATYFPAYEIMMDELRDYRFYAGDMVHPNLTAINFLWEKFKAAFIDKSAYELMDAIEKIRSAQQHLPRNAQSESHKSFLQQQIGKINELIEKEGLENLEDEKKWFELMLQE